MRHEIYSVRTGYHVALRDWECSQAATSSSNDNHKFWKCIWQLKVAPKVQLFGWKCALGILPVTTKLSGRGIRCDTTCRRCGEAAETSKHLFRYCIWARDFWKFSPLRLQFSEDTWRMSLRDWMDFHLRVEEEKYCQPFVLLLWTLWRSRNLLIYQLKMLDHLECYRLASLMLDENLTSRDSKLSGDKQQNINLWKSRPLGYWKINKDVAIYDGKGTGLGVVIRDSDGQVVVSRYKKL